MHGAHAPEMENSMADSEPVPDAAIVQLLIALANVSSGCKQDTSQKPSTTAAEKLVNAINTVMAQKRQQFLHYRLQWLIFEHQQPAPRDFSLPECFSTPRGIHDVDVRQHWWSQVRGFPEALRKHDSQKADPFTQEQSALASMKSRTNRSMMLRRSVSRARLQSGTVATTAKQVARALSRCLDVEGRPTTPTLTPSRRWSVAALEKSEIRIAKPDKLGMTTQELLERARAERETRRARKSGVVNVAALSEPKVFLSNQAHKDDTAESASTKQGQAETTRGDSDKDGSDNERDAPVAASQKRRSMLTDVVINAAGGVEGSRLILSCPVAPLSFSNEEASINEISSHEPQLFSRASNSQGSRVPSGQGEVSTRRNIRHGRPDQLYLQRCQNEQIFENMLNSPTASEMIRYDTARTMTGMQAERPLPMARPKLNEAAASEWGVSTRKLALILSRPVSAPNLGSLQRQRPKLDASRKHEPMQGSANQNWGEVIERDCLPSPEGPRKIPVVASRQRSVESRIDGLLDSRFLISRERDSFGEQMLKELGSASEKDTIERCKETKPKPSRCMSASGGRRDSEKPGRLVRPATATPSRSLSNSIAGETMMQSYLNKAAAVHSVPAIFKCLQDNTDTGESKTAKPLDLRFLNLSDKDAETILTGLERSKTIFDAVLLEGNSRLTDVTYVRLFSLLAARGKIRCNHLQRLELSGAKGMRNSSLQLLARELSAMKELRELSLEGISIPERTWPALESGMQRLTKLQGCCLANTQVGRESQQSAVHVAEIVSGLIDLKSLDISGNFFGVRGCRALADCMGRHPSLSSLDLSYNAGGFVLSTPSTSQKTFPPSLSPSIARGSLRYNPISLVCEGVANARALKHLRLANCQLYYDEDFILEVALAGKLGVGMEELVLSGNPCQGPLGAQCLLRLVIQTPSLQKLDVDEFRHALPPAASIPYDHGDPKASYEADLSHPQHRALLRTILRRCKLLGLDLGKTLEFKNKSFGDQLIRLWQEGEAWPDVGTLTFTHDFGNEIPTQDDVISFICSIGLQRKLKVSLFAFVRVADFFKNLVDNESRRVLIGAMASDLLLKLSHVRCLSEMDAALRMEIIERLLPAVHQLDSMGGFDVFLSAREDAPAGAAPLHTNHKSTLRLLLFNAYCPSSHYELSLDVPADRRILEQLVIINAWDRVRAESTGFADLSQHGDHVALRNLKVNGEATVWTQNSTVPPRGDMVFDFCSSFHPALESEVTNNAVIDLVVNRLTTSRVHAWLKLATLRTVLHFFVLLPDQCARIMTCFPASGGDVKVSLRVDAFATLYACCVDIRGLLSKLYGLELLNREEVLNVRRRLGRLRVWDIMRCEQKQLTPGSSLTDSQKDDKVAAELKLRDDVTSIGSANSYVLDLETFEDWTCAVVLMQLAKKEGGESNFDNPSWSEKAHLEEKGSKWIIPQEWISDKPPQKGILTVTYQVMAPNTTDDTARDMLASKYLGW